jgi:hypothetical protein
LEGLFWARNKWDFLWVGTLGLAFGGFTLWLSKLRGHGIHGKRLDFGLGLGGFTLCLAEGSDHFILLVGYFRPISLDSQQSLATQSHGLSTLTAIAWSDP